MLANARVFIFWPISLAVFNISKFKADRAMKEPKTEQMTRTIKSATPCMTGFTTHEANFGLPSDDLETVIAPGVYNGLWWDKIFQRSIRSDWPKRAVSISDTISTQYTVRCANLEMKGPLILRLASDSYFFLDHFVWPVQVLGAQTAHRLAVNDLEHTARTRFKSMSRSFVGDMLWCWFRRGWYCCMCI